MPWSRFRKIFLLVPLSLCLETTVHAAAQSDAPICRGSGNRFSLLIGNQDYQGKLSKLNNPGHDTDAFAKLLCANGFTVYQYKNLDIASFDRALSQFREVSRAARTTLVYYSGHGFAAGGRNWLVPIDAGLDCDNFSNPDAADLTFLRRRLVDLSDGVIRPLNGSADQIVILDACRVSPLQSCYKGGSSPTLVKGFERSRSMGGRLLVYATQDGQPALDEVKASDTSPLMTAIVNRMGSNPRQSWVSAMGEVSRDVATLTDRNQVPNLDISIPPQGCLAETCETNGPGLTAPAAAPETGFIEFIATLSDRKLLEQLASTNPSPQIRQAAKTRLDVMDSTFGAFFPTADIDPPPSQVIYPDSISSKYRQSDKRAMEHTCRDQYDENKNKNANGGMEWIKKSSGGGKSYYEECIAHLRNNGRQELLEKASRGASSFFPSSLTAQ